MIKAYNTYLPRCFRRQEQGSRSGNDFRFSNFLNQPNADFNSPEFEGIKNKAGLNHFQARITRLPRHCEECWPVASRKDSTTWQSRHRSLNFRFFSGLPRRFMATLCSAISLLAMTPWVVGDWGCKRNGGER